jgi:hypothetical protein
MSTDITVNLSDSVWHNAQVWATQMGRTLPDFLAETIEISLAPLGNPPANLAKWTDDKVLETIADTPSLDEHRRLSALLSQQREGALDQQSQAEMAALMQRYQERLVRNAAAQREAVRRRLQGPLEP